MTDELGKDSVQTYSADKLSQEELLDKMILQDVASSSAISHAVKIIDLERILKEGILSRGFAKKAGLPIDEDYGPVEQYYVHLGGGEKPAFYGHYSPALLATHWSRSNSRPEDIVSLILDPKISIETFMPPYESTREMGKFLRVNPRFFIGIAVSGQTDKDKINEVPSYPNYRSGRIADVHKANIIAQKALSENAELEHRNASRVLEIQERNGFTPLPIYNFKGDLLWPASITHQEIVSILNTKKDLLEK